MTRGDLWQTKLIKSNIIKILSKATVDLFAVPQKFDLVKDQNSGLQVNATLRFRD